MVFRPYDFSIFRGLYLGQIKLDFLTLVSFDTASFDILVSFDINTL